MEQRVRSLRAFIGSRDFKLSREFYRDLGFEETVLTSDMSVFKMEGLAFYLQDYYAKEWVENTMLFMEVGDVSKFYEELVALNLPAKYDTVKLTPIRDYDWGRECFLHDPAGVLWHFGEFK